ncbi:MAG: M20 family metallopeptidase [Candidatus Dormibacteraceae bacterium]
MNPPGDERRVAELVSHKLGKLGVRDVHVVAKEPSRPNLIARVRGTTSGPRLILCGHLDTKPPGDLESWVTDPFDPVVQDGRLVGLGSGDMKAAVAAMVYAAGALAAAGGSRGDVLLVLTADEEAGSSFGSRWLAETGQLQADAAVIGEPSGITREWESIHIISRGAALFKVKVHGTQMHSSVSDRLPAINATVQMARLIDRMDRELKSKLTYRGHRFGGLGPTVNIGVTAKAGVFYGVYPGYAEFGCDIRTLPGMEEAELKSDIVGLLEQAMSDQPGLDAELVWDLWVPATEIAPDHPAVRSIQTAAQDVLGEDLPLTAFPGATDAWSIQLIAGIPTVAAFGPGLLPAAHSPNESLQVDGVLKAAQIYALAAWRFSMPN